MKRLKYFALLCLICTASLTSAQSEPPEVVIDQDIVIAGAPAGDGGGPQDGLPHKFMFISAEMEQGGKVVKGAPYSAEALTERTQTLADGNRIVHKSSAKVFRDSEGRTRREQELNAIGNWEAKEGLTRVVFIQDPVAKMHYVLEPENRTVRKIKIGPDETEHAPKAGEKFDHFIAPAPHGGAPGTFGGQVIQYRITDQDGKKESLGNQTMEGILVEGTRTTIEIPAGDMGNEFPIQIVSERWYSPELQVNIMTKHNDPRFGETVYQLTGIGRGEQDRSLFEVPRDYKVDDSPVKHKVIRRDKQP